MIFLNPFYVFYYFITLKTIFKEIWQDLKEQNT